MLKKTKTRSHDAESSETFNSLFEMQRKHHRRESIRAASQLSILYLRCRYLHRFGATREEPFNSLFEMRSLRQSSAKSLSGYAFNSLFEMLGRLETFTRNCRVLFQFSI